MKKIIIIFLHSYINTSNSADFNIDAKTAILQDYLSEKFL